MKNHIKTLTHSMGDIVALLRECVMILHTICIIMRLATRHFHTVQGDRLITALLEWSDLSIAELKEKANGPRDTVPEDTLHDAKYAAERIGVGDKTLSRLTRKGLLPIHSYVNRKRLFLASDIERCRRYYRGG